MSVVDEVKARINIVDVIRRYTELTGRGTVYKGLCPFHAERTPSFVVWEQTGTWHCFGACGTGGDVFGFLMRKEGLTFREALERLAREAGVSLESEQPDPGRELRDRLFQINELAAAYFRTILLTDPRAAAARTYLERRGIDDAASSSFGIGFALDQWSGLRDHLSKQGVSLELQQQAGLIKRSQERESTYDVFRNRVIFPIRDRQGRVLGFGGRVLDDSNPKYLNTSDTELFHKSAIVYGLDLAHEAIRSEKQVVIVEGYMDVIAAHQHGFRNVVACMGTALTASHLQQLQRLTNHYILALDADAAGQAATIRGLSQARQSLERKSVPTVLPGGRMEMTDRLSATLSIISMPAGMDPDDVVRNNRDQWRTLVEQALPLVDYYFGVVARSLNPKSPKDKPTVVSQLVPLIAELGDPIQEEHYIRQLSRLVDVEEGLLHSQVKDEALRARNVRQRDQSRSGAPRDRVGGRSSANQPPSGASDVPPPPDEYADDDYSHVDQVSGGYDAHASTAGRPGASAGAVPASALSSPSYDRMAHLLALLLREPELLPWVTKQTEALNLAPPSPDDMERADDKELFRALRLFLTSDEQWDLESFQDSIDPTLFSRLAQLSAHAADLPRRDDQELREGVIKDIVTLRLDRVKSECLAVKSLIDEAQRNGEPETVRELGSIYSRLKRDLEYLQPLKHREVMLARLRAPLKATG